MNDTKGGSPPKGQVDAATDTWGQPTSGQPIKSLDKTGSEVMHQEQSMFDKVKMQVEQGEVEKHERMKGQVKEFITQIKQFVNSNQLKNELVAPEELKNKNTTTQVQEETLTWKEISEKVKMRSNNPC